MIKEIVRNDNIFENVFVKVIMKLKGVNRNTQRNMLTHLPDSMTHRSVVPLFRSDGDCCFWK